jgi:hypothetical protein
MQEKFEDNKGVIRMSTDNAMAEEKRSKGQAIIYKTLRRKL